MIYLDHNATTPIAQEVLEAMLPYLKDEWGNAASTYRFGSKLKSVIEEAREKVADLLSVNPGEITIWPPPEFATAAKVEDISVGNLAGSAF